MSQDRGGIIRAFSEDQVSRLAGLSKGQLRAWDRRGFFRPDYAHEDRRLPYSRVYSFKDVVGLRAISILLKDHRIALAKLRKVADELEKRGFEHWADVKLYILKREVHFRPPQSKDVEGVWSGQLAMLEVVDVINDISERVDELQKRKPDQVGQVERHRFVARNAAVISGTRIPTSAIRRYHEAGYSTARILAEYPSLTKDDVRAAIEFEERLTRTA